MLNLYQLQMFVMVAEKGSFSAAAKELLVTQPAVSEGIRSLEQRLGTRLFERGGHRMELTPEGEGLLEQARRLLLLAGEVEQDLRMQHDTPGGVLRIGCATSAAAPTLAALVGAFCYANPQISLKIEPLAQAHMLDLLRDGQLHCAFSGERIKSRSLDQQQVATDEWVLLAPAGHAWAGERADEESLPGVRPAQLREQALVVQAIDSAWGAEARRELYDLLDERGLTWRDLRLSAELPDLAAVIAAVRAGAGVGIIPRSAVASADAGQLFTLQGQPPIRRLFLLRNRRSAPTRAAAAWWNFVAAHAEGT